MSCVNAKLKCTYAIGAPDFWGNSFFFFFHFMLFGVKMHNLCAVIWAPLQSEIFYILPSLPLSYQIWVFSSGRFSHLGIIMPHSSFFFLFAALVSPAPTRGERGRKSGTVEVRCPFSLGGWGEGLGGRCRWHCWLKEGFLEVPGGDGCTTV